MTVIKIVCIWREVGVVSGVLGGHHSKLLICKPQCLSSILAMTLLSPESNFPSPHL